MKKSILVIIAGMSMSTTVFAANLPSYDYQDHFNEAVAGELTNQGNSIDNLFDRSLSVSRELADVKKKAYAGVAGVAAMNNIPTSMLPDVTTVGMAIGGFENKAAVAFGASRMNSKSDVSMKGSFALTSEGNATFGAGVGYNF